MKIQIEIDGKSFNEIKNELKKATKETAATINKKANLIHTIIKTKLTDKKIKDATKILKGE